MLQCVVQLANGKTSHYRFCLGLEIPPTAAKVLFWSAFERAIALFDKQKPLLSAFGRTI